MSHLPEELAFDIVAAADEGLGIGFKGEIPWNLPGDLKFLKKLTSHTGSDALRNAVIMGRKTWETIPTRFRPLRGRHNVVITRNQGYQTDEGVLVCHSLEQALGEAYALEDIGRLFVLGGGEIYREALTSSHLLTVLLTRVQAQYECDAFFPELPADKFTLVHESERHEENGVGYVFQNWKPTGGL